MGNIWSRKREKKECPEAQEEERCTFWPADREAPWCSTWTWPSDLCPWTSPFSLRLTCSSTPKASERFSPFPASAPRVVPLWWHLHVPYNKSSPPETPFLSDVRSSEQEHVLLVVVSSGPGMWWVLGWMEAWAGGLKHGFPSCIWSQAASAPPAAPLQAPSLCHEAWNELFPWSEN